MKVTITNINRKERVSERTNKPFTSLGLQVNEYGSKWLSGFGNKDNAGWKAGDTVEIDVTQKGEYLNFTTPKTVASVVVPSEWQEKMYREIFAIRQEQVLIRQLLQKSGAIESPLDYPASTGPATFDKPEDAGITPEDVSF